jgi:hypothetical protein
MIFFMSHFWNVRVFTLKVIGLISQICHILCGFVIFLIEVLYVRVRVCTYTYRTFIGKFNKTTLEKKFEICKQGVGTVQFGLFQGRGDLRCAAGMDSLRHCGCCGCDVAHVCVCTRMSVHGHAAGAAQGLSERRDVSERG